MPLRIALSVAGLIEWEGRKNRLVPGARFRNAVREILVAALRCVVAEAEAGH